MSGQMLTHPTCLLRLGGVKVDEPYPWVLYEQLDQLDCGRAVVHRFVLVRTARALARQIVLADRTAIHLDAPLVCLVLVVLLSSVDADVADAEFPITDGLLLALDLENHSKHVGVGILCQMASVTFAAEETADLSDEADDLVQDGRRGRHLLFGQ